MDQIKQARPEAPELPITRLGDEATSGMTSSVGIRPIIEADRSKQLTGDFTSADRLLSLLDQEAKPSIRPSDDYTSPGIRPKAVPEERTIIDNWQPRKDNGADRLKNERKPVKDFYFDEVPVRR